MKVILSRGLVGTLILLTCFYFLSLLWMTEWIQDLLSLLSLLLLILSLALMSTQEALFPLLLILSSLVIAIAGAGVESIEAMWNGLHEMDAMVVLLLTVPIVSWVLRQEPYVFHVLMACRSFMKSSSGFYGSISVITQMIACFLLPGSVPVMYHFISGFMDSGHKSTWSFLKSTAIIRGFSLSTLWVISVPSFAYSIELLHAPLLLTIIQGFFLSLAGITLSVLAFHLLGKKELKEVTREIREKLQSIESKKANRAVDGLFVEFIILIMTLIGSIFLIHHIFKWKIITIIPPVILVWTGICFLVKGKQKILITELIQYGKHDIPLKGREMSIFLTAGLLIAALESSGWGRLIVEGLYHFTGNNGLGFLLLLPFMILALGLIGMPPLPSMVIVGSVISGIHLPYPPDLIVLALSIGSVLSVLISPFAVPVILLSGANQQSPFINSFRQNMGYALLFMILALGYLQILLWCKV